MLNEYVDFEIRIGLRATNQYTVYASCPLGGNAEATFVSPENDAGYQALAAGLESFETDEDMLIALGQTLFQALFQGPIKDVYTRSQGGLGPDQGLRLRFTIDQAAASIATLPWEFLADPDHGPLAMLDAPIVRYLPHQARTPTLAAPLPLRVLLTGAQTPPVPEVERELREVREALSALGDQTTIVVEEHLTRSVLQRRLREGFHIWHFVGHGEFQAGKGGALRFEDATGDVEPVSALELGILLQRSGLRLVVLDACDSARLATDPFRSMAPALIRAQAPAVIAMQFSIPEESTRAFAGEFYRALAEGFPIDASVTEGRRAVMGAAGLGRADWGIPVVYTRAADGKLFERPAPAAVQPPPTAGGGVNIAIGQGNKLDHSPITVNTATPSPADDRAAEIARLRELIKLKKERKFELDLNAATHGIDTAPAITMEIRKLEKELQALKQQLQELGG